jgi:hypothetical protein
VDFAENVQRNPWKRKVVNKMDNTIDSAAEKREKAPIGICKIDNGWEVKRNWDTKKVVEGVSHLDYEYFSETFAFPTIDEALAKVKELAN